VRTYGTVTVESAGRAPGARRAKGMAWRIKAEPHVMVRIKRHFARVNAALVGEVWIADTAEVARDLEWFCERFPLDFDKGARAYLSERAGEHREREQAIEQVLSGCYQSSLPFNLALPPRDYQKIAAEMLLRTGRLLLADDVGLGKTLSAIATFTEPRALPALVVTLTHLPRQWEAEIERFAPHLRTHILKTTKPYALDDVGRRRRHKKQGALSLPEVSTYPDVILTSYSKIAGWAAELAPQIRSIVFDEVQELRTGPGTAKFEAAVHLAGSAAFRMGLSATPIYNLGSEIHSVVTALAPDALGTREEFIREWCAAAEWKVNAAGETSVKGAIADPKAFGLYLRDQGLMLRRTRAEVGRELPPLDRVRHVIDCDTGALDAINSDAERLAQVILAQGGKGIDKMEAAGELDWKLRQATGIGKAPFVADFVRLLVESGEKVVLYGWHHAVYDIWRERLRNVGVVFYTGEESVPQKDAAKAAFLEGRANVLVMSLRAGAGVDGLQGSCRIVVFGELDWSSGVHIQAEGRVHRDGQDESVTAYYLVSDEGSDPIVSEALNIKTGQLAGITDPKAPLVAQLQADPDRMRKLAAAYLARRGEEKTPALSKSA